jgi:hypothetical protein
MSSKIIAAIIGALCLGPMAAHATTMNGTFSGTLTEGTDYTGVFGPAGSDLTNDAITGTFTYNTNLLSQSISGGQNTATGTGLGALTATISIGGITYTFTDPTSSSVFVDDGSVSGQSELTLQSTNNPNAGVNESFYLDISDPFAPFVASTDLTQSISATDPFSQIADFSIQDTGPNAASGGFTVTSLTTSQAPATSPIPEPASLMVLALGIGGIAGVRTRRQRAA